MGNDDVPNPSDFIPKIVSVAKSYIGSTKWAKANDRKASQNPQVHFGEGEWKCNLFVYEVLLEAGLDTYTPNRVRNPFKYKELILNGEILRPNTTHDWYKGTVKFFGEVEKQNIRDGDIVTDDTHVGIVYYNRNENCYKTIEANQFQVTTSDWGITYTYDNKKAKYYRYDGRFYHYPKRGMVIW